MPRIPIIASDTTISGSAPDTYAPRPDRLRVDPGASLSDFGAALQGLAQKQYAQDTANRVAQFDYSKRYLDQQTQAPPGAKGFQQQVGTDYDNAVTDYTKDIPDPTVRTAVKQQLTARKPSVMSNAASFEVQSTATNSKLEADKGLNAVENRVRADPQQYDQALLDGQQIINTRTDLPANMREEMKTQLQQHLAKRRFEVLAASASTPEAVDGVVNELTKDDTWKSRMSPVDYDRMLDQLKTIKKTVQTAETAQSRSLLTVLEERNKDLVVIDPREMQEAEVSVRKSGNPALQWKMAELIEQQRVLREERGLPPAELRGRINAGNGEPGALYPSLPPQVNNAVRAGVDITGGKVSAAYLAGTAIREYGGQFKRTPSSVDPQFRPQPAHGGVDLRNVSPGTLEAAGVAGSIFGRPLTIMSGHRSQERQDELRAGRDTPTIAGYSNHTAGMALDVSTAGMTPEEKGKLVDALVQAGFTGFGEYDTHIHADQRGAVPKSYGDREGKTWGGWTYLSPEVAATLRTRGFEAGADAATINRYGAGGKKRDGEGQWQVDYNVKSPTSSATGLFQVIDETWTRTIRQNAEVLGIPRDTPDAKLLAMRGDPVLSGKVAALYAMENKRVVEGALQRPITDAELYMAHFFGGGGAVAFLSAMQSNPSAPAAQVLPLAAEKNKGVFYRDGKPRTVSEVYGNITASFMSHPSRVAHTRNEQRQRIYKEQTKRLGDDPMTYATGANQRFTLSSLDNDTGFMNRGKEAKAVADYFQIPEADMKPLTQSEAEGFRKQIKDGNTDQVMELMAKLQMFGGPMARAAYKQIGEGDKVFEYAAALAYDRKQDSTAKDIIAGQKRMAENPDIKKFIGKEEKDILTGDFYSVVGRSLDGLSPRVVQQISDAAMAHYIETNRPNGKFDAAAYRQSVQLVMGGTKGAPAVENVNGAPVILPPGVTGEQFDGALDRMTRQDYVRLSVDGAPPRFRDGTEIDPGEIAREGKFRAVGGGQYQIEMADGRLAISAVNPNGSARPYLFNADPDEIKKMLGRPRAMPQDVPLPPGSTVRGPGILAAPQTVPPLLPGRRPGALYGEPTP